MFVGGDVFAVEEGEGCGGGSVAMVSVGDCSADRVVVDDGVCGEGRGGVSSGSLRRRVAMPVVAMLRIDMYGKRRIFRSWRVMVGVMVSVLRFASRRERGGVEGGVVCAAWCLGVGFLLVMFVDGRWPFVLQARRASRSRLRDP